MREAGGGSFITVGSVADHVGFPENAAYAASKYGLRGLHETLVAEYRGTGVRLTLVSPGATDTAIWDPFDPEQRPGFPTREAMLRPADVAAAVLFVATRPAHVHIDWLRLEPVGSSLLAFHSIGGPCLTSRPSAQRSTGAGIPSSPARACCWAAGLRGGSRRSPSHRSPLPARSPERSASSARHPGASRQRRLGRARARRRARPRGHALGRHLRQGDLPPAGRRARLGEHPQRHHARRDLLGLRAGLRVRAAGTDLVRHGGERLGTLGRRRPDLEELDLRSARPRVAVRRIRRASSRGATPPSSPRPTGSRSRTDDGAHWTAIGTPRARRHAARPTPRCRFSPTSTSAGSRPTDAAGSSSTLRGNQRLRHTDAGWVAEPLDGGGVPAGERDLARRQLLSRHALRAPPRRTRCPVSGGKAADAAAPAAPAHPLARAPDRPSRQRVHRPDLPLRLDHGRQLPAAPGRRVQQPRRHAGARGPGRHGGLRRAGGGGRAHGHHPPRHHGHPAGHDAIGSTPPTTTTRRWP